MKKIFIVILVILVFTCAMLAYLLIQKQAEIENYLQSHSDIVSYKPIIVERSTELEIGEEYIANIYLVRVDKRFIPKVIVSDSIVYENFDINDLQDTLEYNEDFQTHEYCFTPKRKGLHTWGGVIKNKEDYNTEEYYFGGTYLVK